MGMVEFDAWIAKMGRTMLITIALVLGLGPALADDTFSRAVYCSSVLRGQIEAFRQTVTARGADRSLNSIQRQQAARAAQQPDQQYTSDFNRVREFVASNIRSGDMEQYVSFMVAKKRGELDIAQCQSEKQQAGTCLGNCTSKCAASDFSCLQGCDRQCGAPTCARTDGCSDTSFLPN
jgi:hypothetical protein